jgi:hypothetical protein
MGRLYPWVWYLWGILFLIFEFVPIFTHNTKYTLSDYVWRLENYGAYWTALRYFVAVFCVWLFFHLVFRIFT